MFPQIVKDELGIPRVLQSEIEPRPLMVNTFIDWIEPRLTKDMRVFEWGSGHSSLYLARRVDTVISVEHHIHWKLVMNLLVEFPHWLIFVPALQPERYAAAINEGWDDFDLIIVDGIRRDECIHEAVHHLKHGGLIILDNSDSEAFEGQAWLLREGFTEKRFSGEYAWATNGEIHSTSVFSRE